MTRAGELWTLDDIEALREGWDFEAKRAAGRDGNGQLPEEFWPTYSAMANTRGGHIVLGLKEEADGALTVQGIRDADKVERSLWDQLQNRQKVSANLLTEADVARQTIDGKQLIVVHVPRATRKQRPVYLRGEWTEAYVRVGEGDRRLDTERVRLMLADAQYDTRDERVLPKFGLADLNADSISAYRNLLRSNSPSHPWLAEDNQQLLQKLGGWRRDRDTGEEGLTSAGLLFFGQETSIREVFPYYFLDYQERPDLDDPARWLDRITPDGTWSGNLFDFFRRVIPKIRSDLKVPFELDADLARKDDTHISEALREAVVNAIIHADYEGRTSLQIVKSRDGFVLRNPGTLRLSVEEIRQGGRSDCRNRTLQRMLSLLGFGEQAGSGFSRILRAWREQHWVEPLIADDVSGDFTVLRLSNASLISEEVTVRMQQLFGDSFNRLEETGRLAVATAEAEGRVTNTRLQEITSVHARDLTALLRRLVETGYLEAHGDRRGAWYTVGGLSQSLSQTSTSLSQTPPQSSDSAKGMSQTHPLASESWASRDQVEQAILDVCRGQFLSAREIATALARSSKTIRQNYIPKLVTEGRLELRDPTHPTVPDQAYRTVERAQ